MVVTIWTSYDCNKILDEMKIQEEANNSINYCLVQLSLVFSKKSKVSNTASRLPENSIKSFADQHSQKETDKRNFFSLNAEMLYFGQETF